AKDDRVPESKAAARVGYLLRRALVRAALRAAAERTAWLLVRAALRAAPERCEAERRAAAPRACRASAARDTVLRGHPRHRARAARPPVSLAFVLARRVGVSGTPAGALLGFSFPWRRKIDARAPRLGKADGNGLLRRARAVFTAPNFADLLVHEFARLRGRRF